MTYFDFWAEISVVHKKKKSAVDQSRLKLSNLAVLIKYGSIFCYTDSVLTALELLDTLLL